MNNQVTAQSDLMDQPGICESEKATGALAIGQWYWIKSIDKKWNAAIESYDELPYEWLGCVMEIGSNYVELHSPHATNRGYSTKRVHFDDFWSVLRYEPNSDTVIRGNVEHFQQLANKHLKEVQSITARLGVTTQTLLPSRSGGVESEHSRALVTLSGQNDIKQYETALKLAKDQELPELFEAIKKANEEMARWMTANTLPMLAATAGMKKSIGDIDSSHSQRKFVRGSDRRCRQLLRRCAGRIQRKTSRHAAPPLHG